MTEQTATGQLDAIRTGAVDTVDVVTPALERNLRSRRLLLTTKTLENAIAAPAMTGFR